MFLRKVLKLSFYLEVVILWKEEVSSMISCLYVIKIFSNLNSPCKLKLFPQRWHYSPPGPQSCCYSSSLQLGILYDAVAFKASILRVGRLDKAFIIDHLGRNFQNPILSNQDFFHPLLSYTWSRQEGTQCHLRRYHSWCIAYRFPTMTDLYNTGTEIPVPDTQYSILLDRSSGFWRRGSRGPPHSW